MKKIILSIVFVFASFAMVNANSNIEKIENVNTKDIAEGSPSDCVRSSRNATLALADAYGWDVSPDGEQFDFAMEIYMIMYKDCLEN